jgi:SOS response regulatory protein OraA/RecX
VAAESMVLSRTMALYRLSQTARESSELMRYLEKLFSGAV